ncbi:hypothetical protein BKA70DRAFT_1431081 [Coprinopsis sp. MPI-PUGE-AT-0042]|nr:hypothetical protein BKA70DRAFT_1431081 [Coprinopsis sp. MPI-PUGE-AT-0042]
MNALSGTGTAPPSGVGVSGTGGGTVRCSGDGPITAMTAKAASTTHESLSSPDPRLDTYQARPHESRHPERSSQWEGPRAKPSEQDKSKSKGSPEEHLVVRNGVTDTNRVGAGVTEREM